MRGSSAGTSQSMSLMSSWPSPWVQGICGFTWAITSAAFCAALLTMSTEIPSDTKPRSLGGLTWIIATSSGSCPEAKSRGISDRKIGV